MAPENVKYGKFISIQRGCAQGRLTPDVAREVNSLLGSPPLGQLMTPEEPTLFFAKDSTGERYAWDEEKLCNFIYFSHHKK